MKLNKKRISILVSLMCLLVLLVFTLCSFNLPDYDDDYSEATPILNFTRNDYYTALNILNLQSDLGQFNSLVPIALCVGSTGTVFCYFVLPRYSYTVSPNGGYFRFTLNTSMSNLISIAFNDQGFFVYTTYGSEVSISGQFLVAYRTSVDSSFIENSGFTFYNSSDTNPILTNCYNYWNSYANRLIYGGVSSSELESAYDNGYSDGFDTGFDSGYFEGLESGLIWGEELGYQEGYTEGYQEGIGTGYRDGFLAGEAEGYDTGYADGYQNGYDTGYSDGLEDAPPETVTIVIYEEPVEIDVPGIISSVSSIPDSILSGSFDFEFAGINIYGLLKLLIIVFIISAVIFFIIKRSA